MGKTAESYRLALDAEFQTWIEFIKTLHTDDRKAFEQMANSCRNHSSAGSNVTRPDMFEPMVMSILLEQQKTLIKLEKGLNAIKQRFEQS